LAIEAEVNELMAITNLVLEELQETLIKEYYNDLVHGHPGVARIMELI